MAALVRLLEPLGFTGPAVRTAVSRTVRQGWLRPVRLDGGPGYALTGRAEVRLDEALARVFRTRPSTWDGRWHVVVLGSAPPRAARERLASSLQLIGYGELGAGTWLAPRPAVELPSLLAADGVEARCFHGPHDGDDAALAAGAWDLVALGRKYDEFVTRWAGQLRTRPDPAGTGPEVVADPPAAFAAALRLLHDWRKFLFRDPGLPAELLPSAWPGATAAAFFDRETGRLAPAATRFVDDCLAG